MVTLIKKGKGTLKPWKFDWTRPEDQVCKVIKMGRVIPRTTTDDLIKKFSKRRVK